MSFITPEHHVIKLTNQFSRASIDSRENLVRKFFMIIYDIIVMWWYPRKRFQSMNTTNKSIFNLHQSNVGLCYYIHHHDHMSCLRRTENDCIFKKFNDWRKSKSAFIQLNSLRIETCALLNAGTASQIFKLNCKQLKSSKLTRRNNYSKNA